MRNDGGGAAFPCATGSDGGVYQVGMTLRDAFAIAALQGQLSMHTHSYSAHDFLAPDVISKRAYQYAEAMLAAREKP